MSRAPAFVVAVVLAAGSAGAGEHSGPPRAVFDLTIEHTTPGGKIETKRYRREWRDCEFLSNGEREVIYIDVPPADDYYTR